MATAQAQASVPAAVRLRVSLPAYRSPVIMDTLLLNAQHEATAPQVWAAAERVFSELKIATDKRDSAGGVVGTTRYTKSSTLLGTQMSRFVNCGMSGITGPNADSYRISMAIVAMLTPVSATRTTVGVALAAAGMDMRGPSTDPVMCASTGRLEAEFLTRIQKALATR